MPIDANKYKLEIKKFEKALIKIINRMVESGSSLSEIKTELRNFSKSYNLASKFQDMFQQDAEIIVNEVIKQAEQMLDWTGSKTSDLLDEASAQELIKQVESSFAQIGKEIDSKIVKLVSKAVTEGKTIAEIGDAISKATGLGKAKAWTTANTGVASLDRATNANIAKDAGIDTFKYVGGPPQRAFCSAHYNNTYTRSEIENMSNGQGLDVMNYGGGWNCTHRWIAVRSK